MLRREDHEVHKRTCGGIGKKKNFLERASRSALTKYTINSMVYVSTTNIYLEYIGYMFRPVNRSSSGHQSKKSKVLLR
jgi:hypothetical protein